MALATASATMESSLQETRVQRSYQEVTTERKVKKTKSRRHHKDEGNISVSKSSEKIFKKLKASSDGSSNPNCEKCSRPVYAMERIKAEKRVWHKECFRCVQCNKQLTVEAYQSDHTTLYCKPHFKQLFEPKPVDDTDETDSSPKKHQMIICENNPVELPPDVVRASDKPEIDAELEQLSQLDVKSRFQVFERKQENNDPPPPSHHHKEKGQALLAKLAKFKAKGMDIGVSDEYLNGVPIEPSSSENEDEDEDSVLKKSYVQSIRSEQAVPFTNMSEIVGKFESGQLAHNERSRERKQEIQNIRSRLFMGKQAKIKEMYEQSVAQSEQGVTSSDKISRELELDAEKARAIKQRFENGTFNDENLPPRNKEIDDRALFNEGVTSSDKISRELELDAEKARAIKQRFENGTFNDENLPPRNKEIDDRALFNEGIGKKSRSIFLELDANAKTLSPTSPPLQEPPKRKEIPFVPKDIVRAGDRVEEAPVATADISDRFHFFETYTPTHHKKQFRMTPPRQTQRPKSPSPEVYREPGVARSEGGGADASVASSRQTASRMISVFREMEHNQQPLPQGPKPLKRFTPPPPGEKTHTGDTSSEEEEEEYSSEEDSEEERRRLHYEARERDEALKQAQQLARTKSFRDRFENWSESDNKPAPRHATFPHRLTDQEAQEDDESQLETAKSLRQKFENMKVTQTTVSKTMATKVNRFV